MTRTRQQRRAEAREAAKLLVQEKRTGFRWDYTLALLGLALTICLVLFPPATEWVVGLLLSVMFGLLVYPALHLTRAILQTRLKSSQLPISLVLLAGMVGIFSWWILRSADIELRATSSVPAYGPDSNISGIHWQSEYSELDLMVRNAGPDDYTSLDIEITTDLMFEDLRPQTGLASCIIARSGEPFEVTSQKIVGGVPVGDPTGGNPKMLGGVPVGPADTSGKNYTVIAVDKNGHVISISGQRNRTYRIRCETFPANNQNNFVAALSVINPFIHSRPPAKIYETARPATKFSAKIKLIRGVLRKSIVILDCKMGQTCKG
jgi:hypothetical protein